MGIFRKIYEALFYDEAIKYDDSNPEFSKWAFGDNHKDLNGIEKMQAWNRLHGELLMLNPTDEIHASLCRMGGFWVLHCQKEKLDDSNASI